MNHEVSNQQTHVCMSECESSRHSRHSSANDCVSYFCLHISIHDSLRSMCDEETLFMSCHLFANTCLLEPFMAKLPPHFHAMVWGKSENKNRVEYSVR